MQTTLIFIKPDAVQRGLMGQIVSRFEAKGLQLIGEGTKVRLHIPWQLAYGAGGKPPKIPAKADLIFEIHLFTVDG